MRRAIRFVGIDGSDGEIEITKVVAIKANKLNAPIFHIDKLPDGTYRIIYNENAIPDLKELKALEIIRED